MADNYTYYDLVTATGVIVPDTADLRSEVEAEYKRIFGADLDVSPETPQGRLIEVNALGRSNAIMLNALTANQINPDVATGVFLDAIAALTDCYRAKATKSMVTATGIFLSRDDGPVAAPAASLINIVDGVLSWETVNNDAAAILGAEEQSDRDLRIRRRRTLFTGATYLGALESVVWRVPNVQGVLALDNPTGETVVKDFVTLKPHSVYVAVHGGADAEIALALYKTKTVGADYNGNTTVTIHDPENHRPYEVTFQRPNEVIIEVEVRVVVESAIANVKEAIQKAVIDYEQGNIPNIGGLNIGTDVSPFEIAGAIAAQVPGVYIKSVLIAKLNETPGVADIAINADEIARIPASAVTINLE